MASTCALTFCSLNYEDIHKFMNREEVSGNSLPMGALLAIGIVVSMVHVQTLS